MPASSTAYRSSQSDAAAITRKNANWRGTDLDQRAGRRIVGSRRRTPTGFSHKVFEQPALPGDDWRVPDRKPKKARRAKPYVSSSISDIQRADSDPLLAAYLQHLGHSGLARKTQIAYRCELRALYRYAQRLVGHPISFTEIFKDSSILGHILIDDHSVTDGRQLSKWTLSQRRAAIRSLAALMRPELTNALKKEPHFAIDAALQLVAERVGLGYHLSGGRDRRRSGYVPSSEEVGTILEVVSGTPGYRGLRNAAFFGILVETGARINALRLLQGSDWTELSGGRVRINLHEKGKGIRELELSEEAATAVKAYVLSFNRMALQRGWRLRIHLTKPGSVWRNSSRGTWTYDDVCAQLHSACTASGIKIMTPHALRRFYATQAASVLPRHIVALAGGWKNVTRLDNHYINPSDRDVWRSVADTATSAVKESEAGHATASTL